MHQSEQTAQLQKKVREYARGWDREKVKTYARGLAPRIFPRGVTPHKMLATSCFARVSASDKFPHKRPFSRDFVIFSGILPLAKCNEAYYESTEPICEHAGSFLTSWKNAQNIRNPTHYTQGDLRTMAY